jgi:hypothetical protein
MKITQLLLSILLASIILSACSNKAENPNSNENQKMITNHEQATEEDFPYLKYTSILQFIEETSSINLINPLSEPFNSITFDKVIAYDFEGRNETIPSVIDSQGQFVKVITQQEALNIEQVERIVNLISNKKTYGNTTAACFDPGWAIVFFEENKIQFVVDICMDCNYLLATQEIPASQYHSVKIEEGAYAPLFGFSKKARKSIRSLAKELGMKYGDEPLCEMFD